MNNSIADKLEQIARNEQLIYNAGVEKGKAEVGEGIYEEGFEAGKKSEYDAFWDSYQDYGNRTNYGLAFVRSGWNDVTFKPKYDLIAKGGAAQMFHWTSITNLKKILADCGVVLDTSEATSFMQMFQESDIAHIPTLDMRQATNASHAFSYSRIEEIEKIIVAETVPWQGAFMNCSYLKHLLVEGVIGQNGFNVQWSTQLSRESIESIINALSTTTSGLTVTLSQKAVDAAIKLAEPDDDSTSSGWWAWLIGTRPNWTISLA